MAKKILFIEHKLQPEPDAGQLHLRARGVDLHILHPFAGDPLPDPNTADGVIVMGGPQMVTEIDQHPYLQAEAAFLARAAAENIPTLAICLGAQLLAHALDARVDWHPERAAAFGYHALKTTDAAQGLFPKNLHVLSGNAQGFDMPTGVTPLAHAETWPNQAFAHKSALAFQFHPEITRGLLDEWQTALADNIGRPGTTGIAQQNADFAAHDPGLKHWYRALLDRHFSLT